MQSLKRLMTVHCSKDSKSHDNRYYTKKNVDELLESSYLKLTGGVLTGSISYKGSQATYPMIRFIDNTSDIYGNGISIGGGGATIVGGGESASMLESTLTTGGAEVLILANDGNIDFYTNTQNGIASATHTIIDTEGIFSGCSSGLAVNNTEVKNVQRLQFLQKYGDTNICPDTDWWSVIRTQHGSYTNGYWQEMAYSFHSDIVKYRRNVNGTMHPWREVAWADGSNIKSVNVARRLTGYRSTEVTLEGDSNGAWYRLGGWSQVGYFYGEFFISHFWHIWSPSFSKIIVSGCVNGNCDAKLIYRHDTSGQGKDVQKVRLVYEPNNFSGVVFVDVFIKTVSNNPWYYEADFHYPPGNSGSWVDKKFTKNPLPAGGQAIKEIILT